MQSLNHVRGETVFYKVREAPIRARVKSLHRDGMVTVTALFAVDSAGQDIPGYLGYNYRIDPAELFMFCPPKLSEPAPKLDAMPPLRDSGRQEIAAMADNTGEKTEFAQAVDATGLGLAWFAGRLGLNMRTLARWYSGANTVHPATTAWVWKIARALEQCGWPDGWMPPEGKQ
jgi:hypothetical protein